MEIFVYNICDVILWNRERLKYGSLLCISPDNYKTLIWCTVANRKSLEDERSKSNERSQITVKVISSSSSNVNSKLQCGINYQMAESPEVFFEAYVYNIIIIYVYNLYRNIH